MLIMCEECGKEISDKALACPNCGAPGQTTASMLKKTKRSNPIRLGILVAIAVVLGFIFLYESDFTFDDSIRRSNPLSSLSPQVVTMAKYNRIQEGMTYNQVCQIIGDPGIEQALSKIPGYRTIMYSWTNRNGSGMNATFQNNVLVVKAQFGLQ